MKTKEVKRNEASARQASRDARTTQEQVLLLAIRPGRSDRELDRLWAKYRRDAA